MATTRCWSCGPECFMNANLIEDTSVEAWKIDGGLKLPGHKKLSQPHTINTLKPVTKYILPVQQHIGESGELLVKVGDKILKGQCLAKPKQIVSAAIHSPVSGVVTDIGKYATPHPSGIDGLCIVIENDFQESWIDRQPVAEKYHQMSSHELRAHVRDAGIVGLGGAGFPAAVKQTELDIHTLIINGVECEPYITCDDALMRHYAKEIISGADVIGHIIKARECIVAIEDNKPEAIDAMNKAIEEDGTGFFRLQVIPTTYPSGGEKQLIKAVTGKEIPINGLPADIDTLCQNVATAHAIHKMIYHAEPLISRVITITGDGVETPQNIEAMIGTSVDECIKQCGGYANDAQNLIMGGPMMGFTLSTDQLPVIKTTNCLLTTTNELASSTPSQKHMPCIRCGLCVDVCPARLLPQQLYWQASSKQFERAIEHHLFDCIECGCCSYVCPSKIPLVQYYRYAKSEIWELEQDRKKSDIAKLRHENRTTRIEKNKREREERLRIKRDRLKNKDSKSSELDSKKKAIEDALARVNKKKLASNENPKNISNLNEEQQKLIVLADQRRKQLKNTSGNVSGDEK